MSNHVTQILTRQDMALFAREHENVPITWETHDGPGGTIIIVDHESDDPGNSE